MAGIVLLCFCGVLLGAVPVLGGTEYRLGGIGGNPWQVLLAGESAYQAFAADGQVERQVSVGIAPLGGRGRYPDRLFWHLNSASAH